MFRSRIANIVLAGICNGLLVSLPIGAASMQAALRWANGERAEALALSGGVLFGDIIVAVIVMVLLRRGIAKVSKPYMFGGGVMMVVVALFIERYQIYMETTDSVTACMMVGLVLTIIQPGNYGTYLLNYGWGVQYFFGVPDIIDMRWRGIWLLISMNGVGLIIGWVLYLMAVQRWGMGWQIWFSRLTLWLVILTAAITLARVAYTHYFPRRSFR